MLLIVSAICALLLTDYAPVPEADWQVGEVANRDIKAPFGFDHQDQDATQARRTEAAAIVAPVYDYDATLVNRLRSRVSKAFDVGRRGHNEATLAAHAEGQSDLSPKVVGEIGADFLKHLEVTLKAELVEQLVLSGFSPQVEEQTNELLSHAMSSYVVPDRAYLPNGDTPISVLRYTNDSRDELPLEDLETIKTVDDVRQSVTMYTLEHLDGGEAEEPRIAAAIARAQVRGNLTWNQLVTEERRDRARSSVAPVVVSVAKGTAVVRDGDVVNTQQRALLDSLEQFRGQMSFGKVAGSLFGFCFLLILGVYRFGRSCFRKFVSSDRDLMAMGLLLVIGVSLARVAVELSDPVATALGPSMMPQALWYATPIAGLVLLVRILVNSETALIFSIVVSAFCALLMGDQAVTMCFFLLSGVTAAWGIGKSRERRVILWSGVLTGLMNVAFVLFVDLVRMNVLDASPAAPMSTVFDLGFAFTGGVVSAFLVLGLVPLFELLGFVTDLQLLELANLDHPLLRRLMMRAPGSYHHSIMVGTLAEAGAETIGCNALQARVCAYFHDIGKAVRPQYFVENQQDGINRHERLTPYQSAQVIIDHVRDGGAIAKEYKLPKPIIDNIYMHHGDGLVYYFYMKAKELDPEVDANDFRYPGPRPDTREAGIIMLADKIEAACRSIKQPSPENISAMIQKIINSVMAEGQLQDCPLTLKELYTIAESFKTTVLAIHHHRIAYPDKPLPSVRRLDGAEPPPPQVATPRSEGIITLEIPGTEVAGVRAERGAAREPEPELVDYESPEYLPQSFMGDMLKDRRDG